MTLQNRVLPDGSINAIAMRGDFMGNRGILHTADRRLGTARWTHPHWIICALQFKQRHREVMRPGRYWTELFFLDEAVALAAGHRPCAECRRAAYNAYLAAWQATTGQRPSAKMIDKALHAARVNPRTRAQVHHVAAMSHLPDGCFVRHQDDTWLVKGPNLHRFSPVGYDAVIARPEGEATVITPAPSVMALRNGYTPAYHGSAL